MKTGGNGTMNLFEHSVDCTPLLPCKACEVVRWLHSKLNDVEFAELVTLANGLDRTSKKRAYRRRKEKEALVAAITEPVVG